MKYQQNSKEVNLEHLFLRCAPGLDWMLLNVQNLDTKLMSLALDSLILESDLLELKLTLYQSDSAAAIPSRLQYSTTEDSSSMYQQDSGDLKVSETVHSVVQEDKIQESDTDGDY